MTPPFGQKFLSAARLGERRMRIEGRKINRWRIRNHDDAALFLAKKARNAYKRENNPDILVIGDADGFSADIVRDLLAHGMQPDLRDLSALRHHMAEIRCRKYAAIICTYTDIRNLDAAARLILPDDALNRATFEYVLFTDEDYRSVFQHDIHRTMSFVSPIPTWDPDWFALYEESLHRFEKKCDIRDFMDLGQLVRSVVRNRIPGDIAEFGSYKGHSGYLVARLLEAMDADKKLYLFDTFESFPEEPLGIDEFWSGSHAVDFQTVTERLAGFDFVTLVKGDFTRTFETAGLDRLSLVYVDCDSARATQYLIDRIYPEILVPGGVMIFEDYGHPQLLGTRAVVNAYFQDRAGCLQFFSQFSGFYIVIKLPMRASAI